MTHLRLKLSIAGAVLVCAVVILGIAGAQKGLVYTLPVDQYVSNAEQQKVRMRLCGIVGEESIEVNKAQLWAKFKLKGQHEQVAVAYKGVIPDMFKAGSEVVVEGKRDAAGIFQADVLMTKCASKYEDQPKGHPAAKEAPSAGGRS